MIVKRYRPAFFSGFDDEEAEANTLDELTAIPWVKSWSEDERFYRYSVSRGDLLMAENDQGRHWHVVAILDGSADFGLPEWKPNRG